MSARTRSGGIVMWWHGDEKLLTLVGLEKIGLARLKIHPIQAFSFPAFERSHIP
jgi:hypothetical protein